MRLENRLFSLLGIENYTTSGLKTLLKNVGVPYERMKYYNESNLLPDASDLEKLESHFKKNKFEIMLGMGILNSELLNALSSKHEEIVQLIGQPYELQPIEKLKPVFETGLGKLYEGDCVKLLAQMEANSVDLIFADPPFNLDKKYESGIDDSLTKEDYLKWCEEWLDGCIRVLKHGGSLFIWNIPRWNTYLSDYLNRRLTFKHWIATDIKFSLPIAGKLYPSHYSLLYYTKGDKANRFKPDRLPMEVCRHCDRETKDYGGYKDKMNPLGINLTDVWYDIPPVRHSKYKSRGANELSIKLLDRVIEMASEPGDMVFDPFGGGGSTYITAEIKQRRWIGVEIGTTSHIVSRLQTIDGEREQLIAFRKNLNTLFTKDVKLRRQQANIWTDDTFRSSE
ncbi:MAG: site-specific DNA-methyltransferase [Chitinophagaceae bacterium]|nr:MAG: site-specific DNA-methyltransferase [Chitinophagaceae bacterium]